MTDMAQTTIALAGLLLSLLLVLCLPGCDTPRCREVQIKSAAGAQCPHKHHLMEPHSGGLTICRRY